MSASMVAHETSDKAIDGICRAIADYACWLDYDRLSPEAIHAAKARVIDTLGALIGGFFGESCRRVRNVATQMPDPSGATVVGTRFRTTADMAAFVNATTACHADVTDSYHWPGSSHGHPSDTLMPVFAAAEHAHANGGEFISAVVLAYEIYQRISDVFHSPGFDNCNFSCIATAAAAGKLFRLSPRQLEHCISMAAVPNAILKQAKTGMFYTARAGYAGRAGVFAAMLARAGMEGPHLPFEGKAGWCDHVARKRFMLDPRGGKGEPFKILHTQIKMRPACGNMIAPILAAEKLARVADINGVQRITVDLYKYAIDLYERYVNDLEDREAAYYDIPYLVAAALTEGTVSLRTYDAAHLRDPRLRALGRKIEVIENEGYTRAYEHHEHRARVTVLMKDGQGMAAESGGDQDDLSAPKSAAQMEAKFRSLTCDYMGESQAAAIFDRLWHLEELGDVAELPAAFALG